MGQDRHHRGLEIIMNKAVEILRSGAVRDAGPGPGPRLTRGEARRQLRYELASGVSGLILALFMWGHMFFVGSILLGERGFDWLAEALEITYVAQPTVFIILFLFVLHAALASRKIPAQLKERRRFFALGKELRSASKEWRSTGEELPLRPHVESWLWIWQVRTGMVMLVLGSFHLILMGLDILTPLFGDRIGIEAATSIARTSAGLVWVYAVLLVCVEFHAGIGLYRLAVKWGVGSRLTRAILNRIETFLFWFFLGLGALVLLVLAGLIPPPLAFILGG
jgi:fumarate reductase subunit C